MNNILFIISDLDRGGAQRVLTKIANHISKKFKVRILTLHRQKKLNFYISPKIEIIKLNFVIRSELHKKIVDYFKLINIIRGKLKIYQPNRIISFINTKTERNINLPIRYFRLRNFKRKCYNYNCICFYI